jgi:hypothetical protein
VKLLAIIGIIGVGLVVTVLVALAQVVGWLTSPDDAGDSFDLEAEDLRSRVPTSQAVLPDTGRTLAGRLESSDQRPFPRV